MTQSWRLTQWEQWQQWMSSERQQQDSESQDCHPGIQSVIVPWEANNSGITERRTRRCILGSDGMTKSDCSISLWLLFKYSLSAFWVLSECSLNACLMLSESSWSYPEVILKSCWSHSEVILKSSWRIWGQKMKIVCSRQTFIEQTDRQTDISIPCAPVGAKKG